MSTAKLLAAVSATIAGAFSPGADGARESAVNVPDQNALSLIGEFLFGRIDTGGQSGGTGGGVTFDSIPNVPGIEQPITSLLAATSAIIADDKWSQKVTDNSNWTPPEGLFEESADQIAQVLKQNSDSLQQAMSRLTFYENRAGKNLSDDDKQRLDNAKDALRKLYQQ